jgi:nitrate/nitrite-specific signal transduction histidine kinase
VIALVNSLLKFAESIEIFLKMAEREAQRVWEHVCVYVITLSAILSVGLFVLLELFWCAISIIFPQKSKQKRK